MKKFRFIALAAMICVLLSGCTHWWRFLPNNGNDTSSATESGSSEYIDTPVVFSIGEANGSVGDTIMVPVYVEKGNPVVNADLTISYDKTMLRPIGEMDNTTGLISYTKEGDWNGVVKSNISTPGTISIMMATGGHGQDNCVLFYIPFLVLPQMQSTSPISIDVTVCGITGQNGKVDYDAIKEELVDVKHGNVYLVMKAQLPDEVSKEETTSTEETKTE